MSLLYLECHRGITGESLVSALQQLCPAPDAPLPEPAQKLTQRMAAILSEVQPPTPQDLALMDTVAHCIHTLGVRTIVLSPLADGSGFAPWAQKSEPIPLPGTLTILTKYHLPYRSMDEAQVLVTPLGAAMAAALYTSEALPESFTIERVGIGPEPNPVRAMLIESAAADSAIWILETNLDDCTGEAMGYTLEKLFAAGARDAFYTPIYMKKNRPGQLLRVICTQDRIAAMENVIFTHTTTIGIRRFPAERTVLPRRIETIETPFGPVQIKVCHHGEKEYAYPEYESVKALCETANLPYQIAYQEVTEAWKQNYKH